MIFSQWGEIGKLRILGKSEIQSFRNIRFSDYLTVRFSESSECSDIIISMSGHSKWSSIKRQKGVADVKRGAAFTKLGNAITIATREGGGGDPVTNFRLRLVVDTARAANMPKDNIQRAIDRGLGKGGAGSLESVVYEAYAPGKVALMIEAATDNKNRTTAEVKSTIEKNGGTFVTQGAISWMFEDRGLIVVEKGGKSFEEIFETVVECGADDIEDSGDVAEVYTKPNGLEVVKRALEEKGLVVQSAELIKKATTTQTVDDEKVDHVAAFIGKLEDNDDVQKVWDNLEIF